jgi:hypothetical protein
VDPQTVEAVELARDADVDFVEGVMHPSDSCITTAGRRIFRLIPHVALFTIYGLIGCTVTVDRSMPDAIQNTINETYVIYATPSFGRYVYEDTIRVKVTIGGVQYDMIRRDPKYWYIVYESPGSTNLQYHFDVDYARYFFPRRESIHSRHPGSGEYSVQIDPMLRMVRENLHLIDNNGGDRPVIVIGGVRRDGAGNCYSAGWSVFDGMPDVESRLTIPNYVSLGTSCADNVYQWIYTLSSSERLVAIRTRNRWTNDDGEVATVDMTKPILQIPVTIWILVTPFETTQQRSLEDVALANEIFDTNGCGVFLAERSTNDASGDADAPSLLDIDVSAADLKDLRTRIGYVRDHLNVYYVRTIQAARGVFFGEHTCDLFVNDCYAKQQVVIADSAAESGVLAHEVGHAFTLPHSLRPDNIMRNPLATRMTLGQCIEANMNSVSMVHDLDLRPYMNASTPGQDFDR